MAAIGIGIRFDIGFSFFWGGGGGGGGFVSGLEQE